MSWFLDLWWLCLSYSLCFLCLSWFYLNFRPHLVLKINCIPNWVVNLFSIESNLAILRDRSQVLSGMRRCWLLQVRNWLRKGWFLLPVAIVLFIGAAKESLHLLFSSLIFSIEDPLNQNKKLKLQPPWCRPGIAGSPLRSHSPLFLHLLHSAIVCKTASNTLAFPVKKKAEQSRCLSIHWLASSCQEPRPCQELFSSVERDAHQASRIALSSYVRDFAEYAAWSLLRAHTPSRSTCARNQAALP